MRVTLNDIANEAQVSAATVSKVLNGKHLEARITDQCAVRVAKIADRLGYRRNVAARATATGRFDTIGLLKVEQSGIGLGQLPEGLLNGIERAAVRNKMQLTFASISHGMIDSDEVPPALRQAWGDGLLVFGCWEVPPALRLLLNRIGLPSIGTGIKQPENAVYFNEYNASARATEHLLETGHRRIAYIPDGNLAAYAQGDRLEGFRDALAKTGLSGQVVNLPAQRRCMEVRPCEQAMAQRQSLFSGENRPTAIIMDSVELAYPLVHAASQAGLTVGSDFSLVTFHDVLASQLGPTITTMVAKMSELGENAVDLLLRRIESKQSQPSRVLEYELAVGHTS